MKYKNMTRGIDHPEEGGGREGVFLPVWVPVQSLPGAGPAWPSQGVCTAESLHLSSSGDEAPPQPTSLQNPMKGMAAGGCSRQQGQVHSLHCNLRKLTPWAPVAHLQNEGLDQTP